MQRNITLWYLIASFPFWKDILDIFFFEIQISHTLIETGFHLIRNIRTTDHCPSQLEVVEVVEAHTHIPSPVEDVGIEELGFEYIFKNIFLVLYWDDMPYLV